MKVALQLEKVNLELRGSDWSIQLPDVTIARGEYVTTPGAASGISSALLQLLTRQAAVKSGSVKLLGVPLEHASRRTLVRLRRSVAILSVDAGLVPDWTVQQNVALPLIVDGPITQSRLEQIHSALARLELTGLAASKISLLSTSQRLLVSLAQAMVKSPLLVLSEKLWGDDTNQLVAAVLHVLTRNGSAVLVEGVAQAEPPAELQAKLQAKKAINS